MNTHRIFTLVLVLGALMLGACQSIPRQPSSAPVAQDWRDRMLGEFNNHEQVFQAKPALLPSVSVTSSTLVSAGWLLWRTRLRAATTLEATWLLREGSTADGALVLTPHRPLVPGAAVDKAFDPDQWVALDACALREVPGLSPLRFSAHPTRCATVAPGLGVEAALLPLSIEPGGDLLRVRLFSDQARGAVVFNDLRKVQTYTGWAAINGAGANATVQSSDWHMNGAIRVGNEGGRSTLLWRDGKPSGYSLLLERLTYREGNTPVLKLSVLEDASEQAIVYAWANSDATRIGINLGWVQVGLERSTAVAGNGSR
ncbi:MAG: hypothetical protein ABI650_01965 [Dokdonella sp.]